MKHHTDHSVPIAPLALSDETRRSIGSPDSYARTQALGTSSPGRHRSRFNSALSVCHRSVTPRRLWRSRDDPEKRTSILPRRESEGGDNGRGRVGSGGTERGMRSLLEVGRSAEIGTVNRANWRSPWVTRRPAHRVAVALTVSLGLAETSHHPFLPLVRCPLPLAALLAISLSRTIPLLS